MRAYRSTLRTTLRTSSRSVLLAALAWAASARADAPAPTLRATLTCPAAGEPGRVRCEVEANVTGAEIRWADVEITSVPEMLAPLKGRIGPRDAPQKEPSAWRFALALVAKKNGGGQVTARVRAVACTSAEICVPLVVDVRADVHVGP